MSCLCKQVTFVGKPVTYDGLSNIYSFLFKGKMVALTPLSLRKVSEDQVKMSAKSGQKRK